MRSVREQVGDLVRHHRERARLTQAELAHRIGRSVQLVGRIERGGAAPSFETLEALAETLGVEVRDFFGIGEHAISKRQPDHLAKIVERLASLGGDELEWLDGLLTAALRVPRRR